MAFFAYALVLAPWLVILWFLYRQYCGQDRVGADILDALDREDDCEDLGMDSTWHKPCVRKWAYEAKAKFGEMKDTRANRLMISDWLRRQLNETDMRKLDIARYSPYMLELALIPLEDCIIAQRAGTSRLVAARKAAITPLR